MQKQKNDWPEKSKERQGLALAICKRKTSLFEPLALGCSFADECDFGRQCSVEWSLCSIAAEFRHLPSIRLVLCSFSLLHLPRNHARRSCAPYPTAQAGRKDAGRMAALSQLRMGVSGYESGLGSHDFLCNLLAQKHAISQNHYYFHGHLYFRITGDSNPQCHPIQSLQ